MIKVKICGLTRIEDVEWANKLMPDYVGFVFAPSRRKIDPKKAGLIAGQLNRKIKRVGVFVNPSIQEIEEVVRWCPLDIIQLHGDESPEFCRSIPMPVWKAFRISSNGILPDIKDYDVEAFLLDGYHPKGYGGMNQTFPWELTKKMDLDGKRIILAGGINSSNVLEAISIVNPYAVDVSSGVETDGVKDPEKISEFIRKVRGLNDR